MAIIYHGVGGGVPRKTAKIFASDAATNDVTEFGSTLAGDPTPVTDIADIQNEAYETGWRDAVISDLNYPLMGDMNAVQKVASQQIAYVLQHGVPEYDANTEYNTYDIVNNQGVLYISIQDVNKNHQLSDGNWWSVYFDPNETNAKRDIGEMVFSLLPLSSTDLHLADGSLIQNNGIYVEFCNYIADLYASGDADSCFCSEIEWQASVNTYGVCGKFVYDSVNATVRLPKVTGMVEGTLDLTALGSLVSAGLPSFTHTHSFSGTTNDENAVHTHSGTTGGMNANVTHTHYYVQSNPNYGSGVPAGDQYTGITDGTTGSANIEHGHGFTTGGENSAHQHAFSGTTNNNSTVSSIYGNSNTVQPQTIKGYYYICVANTVATNYTIQLDNIVTDLASKVDKTGDTMSGDLSIINSNPRFNGMNLTVDYEDTTTPQNEKYLIILTGTDKYAKLTGSFFNAFNTDNNFVTGFNVRRKISGTEKEGVFCACVDSTGNDFAYATSGVKQTITNWAFPSTNQTIPIVMQASGATYTSPCDGWCGVRLQGSAAGSANVYNLTADPNGHFLAIFAFYNAGEWRGGYMPVKKGDVVMFEYFNLHFITGDMFWLPAVGG